MKQSVQLYSTNYLVISTKVESTTTDLTAGVSTAKVSTGVVSTFGVSGEHAVNTMIDIKIINCFIFVFCFYLFINII